MGTVLTNQKPQHSRTTATRRRRPPPLPPGPRELCRRDRKSRKRAPPANPGDTSHPQCLPMARNRRECLPTPRVSCHSTARDNVTEVTGAKKKERKKKRQPLPLRMTNFWPALTANRLCSSFTWTAPGNSKSKHIIHSFTTCTEEGLHWSISWGTHEGRGDKNASERATGPAPPYLSHSASQDPGGDASLFYSHTAHHTGLFLNK